MMTRAFSMVEVLVVVVIIGIAGTLSLQALAASVRGARAASERTALVLRVREQRRHQVERMQGLTIATPAPDRVLFSTAVIRRNSAGVIISCDEGDALRTDVYTALALSTKNAPPPPPPSGLSVVTPPTAALTVVCLDEAGRPFDTDTALGVEADTNGDGAFEPGEGATLGWSALGTLFGTGAIVGTVVAAGGNTNSNVSLGGP